MSVNGGTSEKSRMGEASGQDRKCRMRCAPETLLSLVAHGSLLPQFARGLAPRA